MTPDELRALADALEPMARAPRFEDFDVPAFCAWVRAQADAQPVAWRCEVRGDGTRPALGASDWRHYATTTNERTAQAFLSRCGDGIEGRVVPLTAAPAAPQAEQPIDLDAVAMQQMRQAAAESTWMPSEYTSNDWIADVCRWLRDGPPAAAPQAEPKREPLSDEQIELPDYLRLQIASTAAAHDVLVERRRQIESEGWTPEHDDEHVLGEMAALAAFYAVPDGVRDWDFSSTGYGDTLAEALLPNGWTAKAGEDRRRNLVKAGALILAEIERLDRMGGSDAE